MNEDLELEKKIRAAQAGDMDMLCELIDMYMALIDKHSRINGKINEDLKQIILLKITTNIKKFRI